MGQGGSGFLVTEGSLTARERILDTLEVHEGGLCDACLTKAAHIASHQAQTNQICNRLFEGQVIARSKASCPSCNKHKLVNRLRMEPHVRAAPNATPRLGPTSKPLDASQAAQQLDQIRFEIIKMVDELEGARSRGRTLPERLSLLQESGSVPPLTACMMHTLNRLRGMAVYDKIPLGAEEHAVVSAAWSSVRRWWTNLNRNKG